MRSLGQHIVLVFSLAVHYAMAQNAPVFSNFMHLKTLHNPAASGADGALEVFAVYRTQWVGIQGSPSVQALSLSSPLTVANSSVGVLAVNEFQGEERITSAFISYAYEQDFRSWILRAGISGGIMQRAIDGARLKAPEGRYDQGIVHNDVYIPELLSSALTGDISSGILIQTKNLYAGFSANNLLETKARFEWNAYRTEIKNTRYITAMAGYQFRFKGKLTLAPNVIMLSDFNNTQAEVNVILQYKDNIYGGLSLRGFTKSQNDALVVMAGFKLLKRIMIGYSYDFSLSALNAVNTGSHELFVGYRVNVKELLKKGKIIYSPRFL
ncbi:MAG: membrane protein [Chitinophagales bacterium]|nr:MAG: membrane protein [Chitinophagales bacterium]